MRVLKIGGVVVGALIVTTLGISASDLLDGASGSLLSQVGGTSTPPCPSGMIHVPTSGTFSCVDTYEASASEDCLYKRPTNAIETLANINETRCQATSNAEAIPWTFVAREQARALCARSGKRLPTAAEWYHVAIATPDDERCHINSNSLQPTGAASQCVSALGVMDAVGNAWEWVSDDVVAGQLGSLSLPQSGYVTQVSGDGIAVVTGNTSEEQFGDDYFWHTAEGVYGMLRGGYFAGESDAGVYATQAQTKPTLATVAIGFRCVL